MGLALDAWTYGMVLCINMRWLKIIGRSHRDMWKRTHAMLKACEAMLREKSIMATLKAHKGKGLGLTQMGISHTHMGSQDKPKRAPQEAFTRFGASLSLASHKLGTIVLFSLKA